METDQRSRRIAALSAVLLSSLFGTPALAAEYYVSPNGSPTASGTMEAPWDITSALGGGQSLVAGDTLWLRGGTYKKPYEKCGLGFVVKLAGTVDKPIHVRAYRGERVTIDGGLNVQPPSTYLWIWNLEILVSEPRPSSPTDKTNLNRPWGGLNVFTGTGCKYINLVVHDNCQGISFWTPAKDSEIHGCLIYDNGWQATYGGTGHGIYTQNYQGVKTITDCYFTGGYGFSLHAYGESAYVNNYWVEGNVFQNCGKALIGGLKPSSGIHFNRNWSHTTAGVQMGYGSTPNLDLEIRDNTLLGTKLSIKTWQTCVKSNNYVPNILMARPKGSWVMFRPNKYEPKRANLTVINWDKTATVNVDVSSWLGSGETYRIMNPRNFYGAPVATGTYAGGTIPVPMSGAEFGMFVLLKG
jgi:hypothetical protein